MTSSNISEQGFMLRVGSPPCRRARHTRADGAPDPVGCLYPPPLCLSLLYFRYCISYITLELGHLLPMQPQRGKAPLEPRSLDRSRTQDHARAQCSHDARTPDGPPRPTRGPVTCLVRLTMHRHLRYTVTPLLHCTRHLGSRKRSSNRRSAKPERTLGGYR